MTEQPTPTMEDAPQTPLEVAIARVAHEVNRHYCMSLGDYSQVPWDQSPKDVQDSAVAGVRAHLANPKLTPQQSHDAWCSVRMAAGWTYGFEKSEAMRTHPCLVPYDELPAEQRAKDFIFKGVVMGIAAEQARP